MNKDFRHKLIENLISLTIGLIGTAVGVFIIYSVQTSFKKNENIVEVPTPSPSASPIVVPNLSKESIHATSIDEDLFVESSRWNIVNILSTPISTPPFVTNPEKLKNYLEKNSVPINVSGDIDSAYLYLETGPINIDNESVYFFIVDGHSKQGHLVSSESPAHESTPSQLRTEFLYDMSSLPLSQLPFPLEDHKTVINAVDEFLNQDITYKKGDNKRQYFVGGFVSTTRLPNQISKIQIRYKCKNNQNCSIIVGKR